MKAIMMSIQPTWVSKILNGEKTLEIRKDAPKEWKDYLSGKTKEKPKSKLVYIYCTKGNELLIKIGSLRNVDFGYDIITKDSEEYEILKDISLNGKVVGYFTLNEVEEIHSCLVPFTFEQTIIDFYTDTYNDMDDLLKASYLDYYSLEQYLKYAKRGYAWHIDNLVIFDKPKELSEFYKWTDKTMGLHVMPKAKMVRTLTRAPQSWQFIEV